MEKVFYQKGKKKTQRLVRFELQRSGLLSVYEISILNIIASYSNGCYLSVSELSKTLGIGISKTKMLTSSLQNTGLIHKTYRKYKRHVLWIATEECQMWWLKRIKDTSKPWSDECG